MRYARVIAAAVGVPWAIQREKLTAIEAFLADQASGVKYSPDEIEAKIAPARAAAVSRSAGSVAVIPICGVISQRLAAMEDISGPRGASTERTTRALRTSLADPNIKAIVLDVDSPGGTVSGVRELADEIYASRGDKPIVAVANSMAASAAYWIASAADELVVTPGGQVGSIGVYAGHVDVSKAEEMAGLKTSLIYAGDRKIDGNPWAELSDQARASMQAKVDAYYQMFLEGVARGRGQSAKDVRSTYGQGEMYLAAEAVKLGLADRVATLDETLERLGAKRTGAAAPGGSSGRAAATVARELELLSQ